MIELAAGNTTSCSPTISKVGCVMLDNLSQDPCTLHAAVAFPCRSMISGVADLDGAN